MENEQLLSDDETNALLGAMQAQSEHPIAEPTELGSPEAPLRASLARADACTEEVAEAVRSELLKLTARGIEVAMLPAEVVPRNALEASLPPGALVYTLNVDSDGSSAIVFDSRLGRCVVQWCMGAVDDEVPEPTAPTTWSALDRKVLAPLPVAVGRALSSLIAADVSRLGVRDNAQEVADRGNLQPCLRLSVRYSLNDREIGETIVALSAEALGVKGVGSEVEANTPTEGKRVALATQVLGAEVELVAILGRCKSSVRDLLALAPGDLVRLDRSPLDTVMLHVGDIDFAEGNPMIQQGNVAVELSAIKKRTQGHE